MPPKQQISCLLIGDTEHPELMLGLSWLAEQVHITKCDTPAAAIAAAATLPAFDMIVLAQVRPGQLQSIDVESLDQRWPSAKLLAIFSSWCEGEGRSGRPFPSVWRLPAGGFIARLRELFHLDRQAPSSTTVRFNGDKDATGEPSSNKPLRRPRAWSLPRVTTDAERFYYEASEPLLKGEGTVLIAAPRGAYETLVDAVRLAGCNAIGISPRNAATKVAAAIWDAERGTDAEWHSIEKFVESLHPRPTTLDPPPSTLAPVPVLVLLGFPRPADLQQASRIAAAYSSPDLIAVLAKPLRLADLCGELVRRIGTTGKYHAIDMAHSRRQESHVRTSQRSIIEAE